jgi:signal transduction histidine kinase
MSPEASHKRGSTLAGQFLIMAFAVMVIGMLAMGALVTWQIEKSVTTVKTASAAFSINKFIAPHLQDLAFADQLSARSIADLNTAMETFGLHAGITSFRIWKQDGLIVYSSEAGLIGRRFPKNPGLAKALQGTVRTELDGLPYEEDVSERASGLPIIEIFAPVYNRANGSIIAVVELHEHVSALESELFASKWQIWLATALITLNMMGCLFVIVVHSGRIIDRQRLSLMERVAQLSDLLNQNRLLQGRIERAAGKATEDNERLLRRMGYDLHDGIAQLLSLALLRLGRVKGSQQDRDNLQIIRKALSDALSDTRNICKGLLLPEVQNLTLKEALMLMIRTHERRTGKKISCHVTDLPAQPPDFVKIALCRFLQEGLNNAFKHAGGRGQRVDIAWDGTSITIEVADKGPGMCDTDGSIREPGLGLAGLRDRIESIGGRVVIKSAPNAGTCIGATLPLIMEVSDAA